MTTYPTEWKRHDGGECPCDPETVVEVQYFADTELHRLGYGPEHIHGPEHIRAENGSWDDIAAYRIIEPAKPKRETVTAECCVAKIGKSCRVYGGHDARELFSNINLTFDVINGKPDWSTLRAEAVE